MEFHENEVDWEVQPSKRLVFTFLNSIDRIKIEMEGFGYPISLRSMPDARDILQHNHELSF